MPGSRTCGPPDRSSAVVGVRHDFGKPGENGGECGGNLAPVGNRQRRLWRLEWPADPGVPVRRDTGPGTVAAYGTPARMCDEVAERIILDEVMASVWASIATLPGRQARVISLRDISGLSAADLCQELGLSDANQRALLHRARTRVRRDLERLGH